MPTSRHVHVLNHGQRIFQTEAQVPLHLPHAVDHCCLLGILTSHTWSAILSVSCTDFELQCTPAQLPRKNGEGNILLWSNQEGRERGMKYGLPISCFHPQLLKLRHQDPVRDLVRPIRQSDPRKGYTHTRKIPSYIIKQTTVSHMEK